MPLIPKRPRSTLLTILALWVIFYASFTLFTPPLLDDADSVHAEVAREMLLRHDYVTLYANGIRYLEKAPLLYWSIAASFRLFGVSTAAARIPLALTILALALATEAFARRIFHSPERKETGPRAGLYAALILLSSPGIFLYTRITLPDAMVCLWLTLALYAFYLTERPQIRVPHPRREAAGWGIARRRDRLPPSTTKDGTNLRLLCYLFAATCALNVLTKGLIGIVFPVAIVLIYLLLTRGPRNTLTRIRQLHPISSLLIFLAIAAPWHILIALANPTQGHPGNLTFTHHHWQVPLPTNGNVHGWLWFYFINEQFLRYLNLRVPRDYDTVPLYLFWGLCLIWLMPWSAFAFKAMGSTFRICAIQLSRLFRGGSHRNGAPLHRPPAPLHGTLTETSANGAALYQPGATPQDSPTPAPTRAESPTYPDLPPPPSSRREDQFHALLLLILWPAFVLLFFSLSTRQEYYVLPALPAIAILIAGWLALPQTDDTRQANLRVTAVLLALGTLFAAAATIFLLHTRTPSTTTDLATLLQQNPADYALSMGHFLDLNANALGLFRLPLALAAAGLFLGPLISYVLRKKAKPHAATLTLAAGAFTFLLAAHLALQTFAPVLTSQQLAAAIAPQLQGRVGEPPALIVIHQEYEFASTLGFYLKRNDLHILEGRSSNLWYGSFFPDAPAIFETPQTLAQKWPNPQRIFLWQDLANQPNPLPPLPGHIYVIAKSGGKEILSNQPNR